MNERPLSPCCNDVVSPEHDRTDYGACESCGLVYSMRVLNKRERRAAHDKAERDT